MNMFLFLSGLHIAQTMLRIVRKSRLTQFAKGGFHHSQNAGYTIRLQRYKKKLIFASIL